MNVSYKACDICGRKMESGIVIDARTKVYMDGKYSHVNKCFDICDACYKELRAAAKVRKEAK